VERFEAAFVGVGVGAGFVVVAGAAGERHRGAAVPRRAGEGRVDDDAVAVEADGQVAVDVDEAGGRDRGGGGGAEAGGGGLAIDAIDAMNEPRQRFGEALTELGEA